MILRIFQVTTEPGKAAEFRDFFENTAIPMMLKTTGLEQLLPGLPRPDRPDTFCMVMVWRDLESLKAFVGEDWSKPHIAPDEIGIVKERTLAHYDLVAT